jgi:hypothetical protein
MRCGWLLALLGGISCLESGYFLQDQGLDNRGQHDSDLSNSELTFLLFAALPAVLIIYLILLRFKGELLWSS